MDNIVTLIAKVDGLAKIRITGFASNTPTNIDNTKDEVSVSNNEELASQRAEAMKSYLITYAKNIYDIDISGNIEIIEGGIDNAEFNGGNEKASQRTEVEIINLNLKGTGKLE